MWVERRNEASQNLLILTKCITTKDLWLYSTCIIAPKTQFLIYMVLLPGHFVLNALPLQCSPKKVCQEDKKWKSKKNQREGIQQLLFLCCSIICCFLNSCFCENRKTSRASDKTLPHPPSLPILSERIFLVSFHQDSRMHKRFGRERGDHFFFLYLMGINIVFYISITFGINCYHNRSIQLARYFTMIYCLSGKRRPWQVYRKILHVLSWTR